MKQSLQHLSIRRAVLSLVIAVSGSWVSAGTPYCFGDGTGTACPCGNNATTLGNGCANSAFATGSLLSDTGVPGSTPGTDTLVLSAANVTGVGLFFAGTGQAGLGLGVPFGDGLLCANGTITRLAVVFPVGGVATYPLTGQTPIHVLAGTVAGNVRHHQFWYRDGAAFCTGSTHNLTNGLTITSVP